MWRQEALFHAGRVPSIITKGAGGLQLLPINFCWLLAWQPHADGGEECAQDFLAFPSSQIKVSVKSKSELRNWFIWHWVCGKEPLWSHYKKGWAAFILCSTSWYTNQTVFAFQMHLLWGFHCQKMWLDSAFLNLSTHNCNGSCYNHSGPSSMLAGHYW